MKTITILCGACQTQHSIDAKNFSGGMARTLVNLCARYQQVNNFIDAKQAGLSPGDLTKLSLWGFVSQAQAQGRKKKSGLWSPTSTGWDFAKGQTFSVGTLLTENDAVVGNVANQITIQQFIKSEELLRAWGS